MSLFRYSFLDHLKTSLCLSLVIGSLMGLLVLIGTPFFLDNLLDLVIFCLLIPSALGVLAALIFFLFQQKIPSVNRSIDRLQLPFIYMISLLLFLVAASFSGFIYLFVSTNLVLHLFLFLVYFSLWFFMLSRVGQPKFRLSSRHLVLIVLCLFISTNLLYVGLYSFRNFKVPARVFMFGIDGATWSIINPLIEKERLPNIAKLKKEGSYGILKSIEPTLSPILWTTIATGKVSEKHGIKDFYSTRESLRTKRIWDLFEAQGMKIGIFRWFITWPPWKVNGFVIPDILARDAGTFPPEYSAINSLRISVKSRYSLDVPNYIKLTWSLTNMGLRMSTLREIGWDFFLNWLYGGDAISEPAIKHEAELRINKDVFIYLLKKYQPQFVVFYDNGVDRSSHMYWKYYEPQYSPEVTGQEIRRYGNVIPDNYELVDQALGDIMQHLSDDTLVVVISDHGFQASRSGGYTLYSPKLTKLFQLLELDSVVYGIAQGGRSYIKLKDRSQTDLLKKAQERLSEIKVIETGEMLLDVVPDKTSLIAEVRGEAVDFNYHVRIHQKDLDMEEIIYKYPPTSGIHHLDGILLMKGPHVGSGIEISGATVLDVTPTILYLETMPISKEVDGNILFSGISKNFQEANSAQFVSEPEFDKVIPSKSKGIEFDKQVEERLKSLGYVQ